MERDDETGLSYHNARYYIPWLGRWLNTDPIGIGDGLNIYAYCRNNPITYNDVKGTQISAATSFGATANDSKSPAQIKFEQLTARFEQLATKINFAAQQEKDKNTATATPTANNPIGSGTNAKATADTQNMNMSKALGDIFVKNGLIPAPREGKDNGSAGVKLMGLFKAAVSIVEIAAGVASSELGVGVFIAAQGLDNLVSGLKEMQTGKTAPSFITSKLREGLEAIGVDKDMAGDVAELLNVASQIVATGGLGANSSKFAAKAEKIVEEGKVVAKESQKLISQFSTGSIDEAVSLVMSDPNKVAHLFPAKHNLGPLVNKLGGQENTVRAVLNAANGKLPASGVFKDIPIDVAGSTVFVRGNVINGIPRLGTMFIP